MKNRLRNAKSETWSPTACRHHAFGWVSTRRDGCSDFNVLKSFGIPILVFGLFLLLSAAQAQQYAIDWFTIDGGGGTSTGGVYSVSGTIGQPDAAVQPMAGGNYSLIGGFWSVIAVAAPGSPNLKILLTTTNTVVISWPSPSTGFVLQQNGDLNTANWLGAPQTVNDDGTNRFIIVNPPTGNRYYRLVKP
jgi:hypothetical protein